MKFKATRAPRGRLVRLGVVLDTRNTPRRVQEVARMCDRAGLDALWVRDHLAPVDGEPRLEAWMALCLASHATTRARVGAHLTIAFRPPSTLAAMAGTLDAAIGGRLELGLSAGWVAREHFMFGFDFPDEETRASGLERYARILRGLLAGDTVAVSGSHDAGEAELGVASPQPGGPPISVEALSPPQMAIAARVADDVVVPADRASDIEAIAGRVRAACVEAGRDPATLGLSLEVPVSIGRTRAEAEARADHESLFRTVGSPMEAGVFGTLEECQERVIQLAHAGVTDLRCILPNSDDVHDVLAQLTAIAVGTTEILAPNAPRSKAPDPPETWGGRSSRP